MRKRSSYKPKGVRMDNMAWVASGLRRVGAVPEAGVHLKLKNAQGLDALLMGNATKTHVDIVIAALNVAEALYIVNPKLGADWADEIKEGQDAMFYMSQKGMQTGRFLFTGEQMSAVKTVMAVHDVQLDEATVQELEKALGLVNKFISLGKARVIDQKETA